MKKLLLIWSASAVACANCLIACFPGAGWTTARSQSQEPDSATPETTVDYVECTIAPPEPSGVPKPLRQGEFLSPQSVSALAISPDGRQLAVTTMAFRHDYNFWLLAEDGRVLWGRYLEPWAPGQVAFLPHGKRFAVGLAYSRFTDPNPTLALFDGENDAPIYGCDDAWELGWMRYGTGDWRTGCVGRHADCNRRRALHHSVSPRRQGNRETRPVVSPSESW